MNIGDRIRLLRKELSMTQTDFGKRVAIGQGYLTNIENGQREATDKIIKLICHEFNISEQWLRTGEGNMFNETSDSMLHDLMKQYNLDELDYKIIIEYAKLNAEQRDVIKHFVSNLINNDEITLTTQENNARDEESDEYNPYSDEVVQAVIEERRLEKTKALLASQNTGLERKLREKIG